jgi:hypothetical protein
MTEYIIWGLEPDAEDDPLYEKPLYTLARTPEEAERVMAILENDHGCRKLHVQTLDLSEPFDFVKAAGLR